jgi:hypothetical protein
MSEALRDAGSSAIFWLALAVVLAIAVVGYLLTRRDAAGSPIVGDAGRVVHDWIPTGRIDFAGPSMEADAVDTPAAFFLQAEEIRRVVSLSGIERKEIRWRKATLGEAKRVVNIFHRQMVKEPDRSAEGTGSAPAAVPLQDGEETPTGAGSSHDDFAEAQGKPDL